MGLALLEVDDANVDEIDAHLLRASNDKVEVLHDVKARELLVLVDLWGKKHDESTTFLEHD